MPAAPAPPPPPPARYRITAPAAVTGGVCGVAFANGHAVATDPAPRVLAWFRDEPGYVVESLDPEPAPVVEPEAAGDAEDVDDEAADEAADEPEEDPSSWL